MTGTTNITSVLGPLAQVLEEPDVVEISCNPSRDVWVERFGQPPALWGTLERDRADPVRALVRNVVKRQHHHRDPDLFQGAFPEPRTGSRP